MALSGQIKFRLNGPDINEAVDTHIIMDWTALQNVAGCYSDISYTLRTDKGGTVPFWGIDIRYAVNATTASSGSTSLYYAEADWSAFNPGEITGTFATGSFRVNHLTSGEGSVAFWCELDLSSLYADSSWSPYSSKSYTQTASLTLDIIPTVCTISCSTVDIGRNPTITIVKPVSSFKNTIRYEFGSLSGTIVTKTSATTYSSWSIPTSFLEEITNGKYGEGTIYCDTYTSAGVYNGTGSSTFRVNVPSLYGPTLDPTFKDVNSATVALTGDSSKIIQYFSSVQYDTGAYAATGATIKSQKVTNGSQSKSTATGTFYNVESNTFTIAVTDSRGYTTTENHYLTMVPYIKLTANTSLAKVDTSSGYVGLNLRGNFFGGGFGVVDNVTTVSYRYKVDDGAWSSWTDVVYNIVNDEYQAYVEFTNLDYKGTYVFQSKAVDKLMSIESSEVVVKIMPVFDWGPNDFNFNVPVAIDGDLTVTGTISSLTEQTLGAADFVVETGTSDIWTYRKWDSGAAECWGTIAPTSISITGTWGSIYIKDDAIPRVYYPFEFIDVPVVSMSLYNTTGNCWSYTGTQGSALMSPAFGLARGTSGSVTTGAQITAIGRWK